MNKLILGIDPGLAGGVSVVSQEGIIKIISTPVIRTKKWKGKSQYDATEMVDLLVPLSISKAYVEKVHSMPSQGVASSFTFGVGWGMWLGILAALKIPHELVTPQRWQKTLFKDLPGKDPKQKGKLFMSQRFPGLTVKKSLIDACLIGYWGYLESEGLKR